MTVATETNVVITPTRSANLATGGNMEGVYTGGVCDAIAAGQSFATPAESAVAHGGSKAQSLTANAQAQLAWVLPSSYTQYGWYDISFWTKRVAGSGSTLCLRKAVAPNATEMVPRCTTSGMPDRYYIRNDSFWHQYRHIGIGMHATSRPSAYIYDNSTSGFPTVLLDDVEIYGLTLASLFHEVTNDINSADVNVRASFQQGAGCTAGVIARCNDFAAPTDYLIAMHDGVGSMVLAKVVSGVPTALITDLSTTAYCEDVAIEIRCTGTTISMWYGGVQVGTNQTVNEASINSNVAHGIISTAATNTCTTVSVMPYEATARWWNNWKLKTGNQGLIRVITLMQASDTITLDPTTSDGDGYTFGKYADQLHLYSLPSGAAGAPTQLIGNGAVIDCTAEYPYLTDKSYIDISGLRFKNFNPTGNCYGFILTRCDNINGWDCTWTNSVASVDMQDVVIHVDCTNCHWYDCSVYDITSTVTTCDGFEFSESSHDCGCYRCTVRRLTQTATENDSHAFEAWANGVKEPYNISFVDCEADGCNVGFSAEGGTSTLALVNIVAERCRSYNHRHYEYQGKDGATLKVIPYHDRRRRRRFLTASLAKTRGVSR